MKILMISGSNRTDSQNVTLLQTLPMRFPKHEFQYFDISQLPLFVDQGGDMKYPGICIEWRNAVDVSDIVIICTPEYIHNIPAALKNALEWITQSGELVGKRVLPITYTPSPPRGEKAMQSLVWSLQALDSNIVGQLDLYQSEEGADSLLDLAILELLAD